MPLKNIDIHSPKQISTSLEGELSKVSCLIFCSKQYDNINSSQDKNWEGLISFYEDIITKTENYHVNILVACCIKYQIRCLCAQIEDHLKAIKLF